MIKNLIHNCEMFIMLVLILLLWDEVNNNTFHVPTPIY